MKLITRTYIFCLIIAGCLGSLSTMSLAAGSDPVLLVVEKSNDHCQFRFQFPNKNKTEDWFLLAQCLSSMDDMIFDMSMQKAYFRLNNKFVAVKFQKDAKFDFLGSGYEIPSVVTVLESKIWLDKISGNIRVAYLIPWTPDVTNKKLTSWLRKKFPAFDKAGKNQPELNEGTPGVALVVERQPNASWKELDAKLTTYDSEAALGLQVLQAYQQPKPGSYSLNNLLMSATCVAQDCSSKPFEFADKNAAWIKDRFTASDETEQTDLSYISLNDKSGLLAWTSVGDSLHWVQPLFYCTGNTVNRCETHQEIPLSQDQLGISVKNNYFLVTNEYYGTKAILFNNSNGRVVSNYHQDTIVVWMPDDFVW